MVTRTQRAPASIKGTPRYATKSITFQLKAVNDETGEITGYGAAFNNLDSYKDIIEPGSFKRTINSAKSIAKKNNDPYLWVMLWQHDQDSPIGGWSDASEDANGLYVKGQIDLDVPLGQWAYSAIKKGYLKELSIGYDPVDAERDANDKSIRHLKEIKLWEISPVTFAANDQALITGVKSQPGAGPRSLKEFADEYRAQQISDWLSGWYSLTWALKATINDAFDMGDQPMEDAQAALDAFGPAFKEWIQRGIDLDYAAYLDEQEQQQGSGSDYYYGGYMAAMREFETKHGRASAQAQKEGRTISADTSDWLAGHASDLHQIATKAADIRDDIATVIGRKPWADADTGKGTDSSGKSSRQVATTSSRNLPSTSDVDEDELNAAFAQLNILTTS